MKRKPTKKSSKTINKDLGYLAIVTGFVIALTAAVSAFYDSQAPKYNSDDDMLAAVADIEDMKSKPSEDLAAFIKSDVEGKSGCDAAHPAQTFFRGEFHDYALVNYGCGETVASMYLMKKDGAWQTISPTNMFVGSIPRCELISQYSIPRALYMGGCFKARTMANSPVIGEVVVSPQY